MMFIPQQEAQNIVNEMKASIHQDINIMDEDGMIFASTNPVRCGKLHQGAVQLLRNSLPSLVVWADDLQQGVQQGINLPIVIDGKTVGVIGITGAPEKVSVFGDIIKRMTEIMAESVRQKEQSDLIDRAKGLFMENWLFADRVDWAELEVRGRLLSVDIQAPYTVALLRLTNRDENGAGTDDLGEMRSSLVLRMIHRHIQENRGNCCAVLRSHIIVLLCRCPRGRAAAKIRDICQDIEGYYPVRVSGGISSPSRTPQDIRRCYLEARTAGTVAARSAGHRVVFYDEASLEFLVQSIPKSIKEDVSSLIFSSCNQQEREEFIQTIQLYFDEGGDIRRCAEKLFIHRNTFQYRMDCLKKKTGYDLRRPKDAVRLYLSIQFD